MLIFLWNNIYFCRKNIFMILSIETATKNCSVALSDKGVVLAVKEVNSGDYSHGENLHVFIRDIILDSNLSFEDLDAVAVSKGPGSYTGLRIGVSAAKGICFAQDIPLIAVNTLAVLAEQVRIEDGLICPVLDARRDEVYRGVYSATGEELEPTSAHVLTSDSYSELEDAIIFVGDAVEKTAGFIGSENMSFLPKTFPSAKELALLAEKKLVDKSFEDLAYFEPYYLKDFKVSKPKKLL
jgi:tRNA threonylcarbamoyladenosine biosynthesis protein TsaB